MDAQTALDEIISRKDTANPMSVNELRVLADRVDASAGNATVLLYSGGVGEVDANTGFRQFNSLDIAETLANGSTVKTIINTEIGKFLKNKDFISALQSAAEREGLSFERLLDGKDANGARINNDSLWDKASARLVNEHTGDFRLLMPNSPGNNVATDRKELFSLPQLGVTGINLNATTKNVNFGNGNLQATSMQH